jgi:amino acid transporter
MMPADAIESRVRDAELVRAIGPGALAANIVNMMVGAGIFVAPAALAASVGAYAPFAFLICGGVVGAVAICFAEGGSRVPTSGGPYGYIEAAFGRLAGYVAGTSLWVSDVLACGGVAAALGDVAASLGPATLSVPVHAFVIVAVVGAVVLVNIGGVSRGAQLVKIATTVKLLPLVVFVVAGAFAVRRTNLVAVGLPDLHAAGRAMLLALFALTGMEGALGVSGEVDDPSKTIPRAIAIGISSVALLYLVIQIIGQGILGPALAGSAAPLADAMAPIHPALRGLMLAGAALSMAGFVATDILSSPRILFAMAQDGLLPRPLGAAHPRCHTPHVAIVCYGIIAIALALTGTFAELAVLATLAVAVVYILGCAAAWRLKQLNAAEAGRPLNFRWLGSAAFIGILSMVVLITVASRAEILGLLLLIAVSVGLFQIQMVAGRRRPRVHQPN